MPRDALRAWFVALLLACAALGSARTAAQQTPYYNHLVGERAQGLAGAYVAVADDPSAVFHNPGGIATINTAAVSGSLWALLRSSRDVEDGYRTSLGAGTLEHGNPLSLPMFLAGVVKFGKKGEDGVRPHALGAALFAPLETGYRFVEQLDDAGAVDRLEVRHNDGARWVGLSYGYRPRFGLSLGLSAFLANRSISHDEVEIRAREDLPADSTVGSTLTRASTLEVSTQHLVFRIGALLHLTHGLNAGIMFQPPGVEIGDSAEAEHLATSVGPDPTAIAIDEASGLDAQVPMPWELRFGLTMLRPPDALLTLDLSLIGPVGASDDQSQLVETSDVPFGLLIPRRLYRRPSLRAAVGFETVVADFLPLRGGGFFERSSAPEPLDMTDRYSVERVHYVGASFSVGVRTGGYDFAVGATAMLGFGEGLALVRDPPPEAPPRYEATGVRERMIVVFIGGARSVVRTLVKTLLED